MLPAPHTLLILIALAAALLIFRAVAWRVWQALRPESTLLRAAAPGEATPPEDFDELSRSLAALGFVPLGARMERPRFGKALASFDFAHPAERTFATAFGARGKTWLYFLSPLEGGPLALTAAGPSTEASAREDAWRRHRERCQGRAREGRYDATERLALARAWYAGEGKREIRRQHLPALLWSLLALGMVLWVLFFRT